MTCVVLSKSLTTFIPIVKSTNFALCEKARDYIRKMCPNDSINLVFGSDDYPCERAEDYLWE